MTDQSTYLKIARAIDGDDWYVARLKMCAEIEEIPYTRQLGIRTTNGVANHITVDADMAVDTTGVTDNQIRNAMKTQWARLKPKTPDTDPDTESNPID